MVIKKRKGRGFVVDGYIKGERYRKSFRYRRHAELHLKAKLEEIESLGLIKGETKTLKQAIKLYTTTETSRKSYKSKNNEKSYFEKLYTFLRDECDVEYVHEIKLEHLTLFRTHLSQDVANTTVNRHFHTYKHFFSMCEQIKAVADNPCRKVKALPEKKNKRTPWTPEQIDSVLAELPTWAAEVFFVTSAMGLRPGDAPAMKMKDIDFQKKRVRVLTLKGTGEELEDFLPIPESVLKMFQQKKSEGRLPEAYVFANPSGEQVKTNYFGRVVRETLARLGMKGLVPYGLRHGYITHLKDLGIDMHTIQMLARHRSIKTTENYFHNNDERLNKAVEEFEKSRISGHKVVTSEEVKVSKLLK